MGNDRTRARRRRLWATACLLAMLFVIPGCNARKGSQALREGKVAELQGDWELARQKYAEACALEKGEAFRKLAELSLRHDTEVFLQLTPKDEAWGAAAQKLSQTIANIGREAASHGFPVEELDAGLAAFESAVEKGLEETREAERAAREAERLAEERRREAERVAQEQRKKEVIARLREEEKHLEQEIRETESEIEECSKKIAEYSDEETQRAFAFYALMNGKIESEYDAYRLGEELGLETNRLKDRKATLEESLPALRRKLEDIRRKLANPDQLIVSDATGDAEENRREELIQSLFSDMGVDTLVEASEQAGKAWNDQQEAFMKTLRSMAGEY